MLSTLIVSWNKDYVWRLSNMTRLAGATTGLAALVSNVCTVCSELVLRLLVVLQGMCLMSLDNVHKASDIRCMCLCTLANKVLS